MSVEVGDFDEDGHTDLAVANYESDNVLILINNLDGCWDHDGDGYNDGACGGSDCDDTDPNVYPSADEVCDGKDNDCDGIVPEDEVDEDGDGWMICEGDCDDTDPDTYPGAVELCDLKDNNCNGLVDDNYTDADSDGYLICQDCDDLNPNVNPGAPEIPDNGIDDDCDGYVDEGDCYISTLL